MKSQTSSKIIAAGGIAAVIGIGVVIFAMRSDPVTPVAETPPPPAAVAQTPATAPDASAQIPAAPVPAAPTPAAPTAPAVVAQIPVAPAAVAHKDSVGAKKADTATPPAVEPKIARNKHPAKEATDAVVSNATVTPTAPATDTREKSAAETVAINVEPLKGADEVTTTPANSSSPTADQKVATSTESAAADSQITADVKSAIAGDSVSKDLNIGVTTIRGVVVLTGILASQDAIDKVKAVAGKVKDVKSVDTSALTLASL
jgi:hyperosmotically inducible protein